jgi:hypothetical protein
MRSRSLEAFVRKTSENGGFNGNPRQFAAEVAAIGHDYPPISAAIRDHSMTPMNNQSIQAEEPMTSPTTTTEKAQTTQPERRGEHTQLSRRYGSIGIEAVAAAARYTDRHTTAAHLQATVTRIDLRFVESAV